MCYVKSQNNQHILVFETRNPRNMTSVTYSGWWMKISWCSWSKKKNDDYGMSTECLKMDLWKQSGWTSCKSTSGTVPRWENPKLFIAVILLVNVKQRDWVSHAPMIKDLIILYILLLVNYTVIFTWHEPLYIIPGSCQLIFHPSKIFKLISNQNRSFRFVMVWT